MSFAEKHCDVAVRVLECVATGAPLGEALQPLLDALERQSRPIRGAILLHDPETCEVSQCFAPNLPLEGGGEEGENAGCPLSADDLDVVGGHLESSWRVPIVGRGEDQLGTLACFWENGDVLTDEEEAMIREAARLAGIAVERARSDDTLRQRRDLFEMLASSVPGAIFQYVLRPDGSICVPYVSRTVEPLYGIDPEALEEDASTLQTIIHPADWEAFETSLRASAETLSRWTWEGRILPPTTDEVRWVQAAGRPARQPDGSVLWNGLFMDITEQKVAEEALRRSEKRYHTLFENAGDAIFIMRGEKFFDCNARALEIYGCEERSELIGHTPWEFSPERQPDGEPSKVRAEAIIREAFRGEPQHFYWRHTRKDGTPFDAEVTLNRLRLGDEDLIQAIVRDVTERHQARRALEASEKRYRRLVERTSDWVWETDAEGHLTYVSPQVEAMTGYTKAEVLGHSVFEFMEAEGADTYQERLAPYVNARRPFPPHRNTLICKDGSRIHLETSGAPIFDEEGRFRGYHGISRDVTERVRRQEELERSASRLGIVNEISAAILRASTPEEIAGATLERLEPLVPFKSASVTEYDYECEKAVFLARTPKQEVPEALRGSLSFEQTEAVEVPSDKQAVYVPDLVSAEQRTFLQETLVN